MTLLVGSSPAAGNLRCGVSELEEHVGNSYSNAICDSVMRVFGSLIIYQDFNWQRGMFVGCRGIHAFEITKVAAC